MPNNISVNHVRHVESSGNYIVDIVVNGVSINGLSVTIENNGAYDEVFFKAPVVVDGFNVVVPSVDFPCDMEIEIRERLKEALIHNGRALERA